MPIENLKFIERIGGFLKSRLGAHFKRFHKDRNNISDRLAIGQLPLALENTSQLHYSCFSGFHNVETEFRNL